MLTGDRVQLSFRRNVAANGRHTTNTNIGEYTKMDVLSTGVRRDATPKLFDAWRTGSERKELGHTESNSLPATVQITPYKGAIDQGCTQRFPLKPVALATVIFVASQKTLSSEVKSVINQQLENVANSWTVYKIARQASRMGNHDMAGELYHGLLTQVASEHFYFWLNSLKEFSKAEQCLAGLKDNESSAALTSIAEALKYYQRGIASLTAASTPSNPLTFQCEFVKLRIDVLLAFSQLICTCNSLKTSPPPAIATAIAMASGNDLQRCGRITNQDYVEIGQIQLQSIDETFMPLDWAGFTSRSQK
ncbi:integrator complex subunit 7-like [Callorhinchus milii]|uniref:integrator complex subunit 7-like n=1 Tax=Callorhinchus milii TaxID=7868 RepID=UPI001C3FD5FE|nr:integrator complex subunit 7-like [Callorhinchus milii]